MEQKMIEVFRKDTQAIQKVLSDCTFLKIDTELKILNDTLTDLNSPLQVMVMGAFSTGKSSFINALFGEEIAMVGALPTTAAITKLSYGNNEQVTVHFLDGTTKNYSVDNFAQMTTENNSQWKKIQPTISFVERTLPKDILKNINLIDSPGLEAITEIHTHITKKFLNRADVVFWMFTAENVGTDTEIKEIKKLDFRLKPIAIINKMDTLDEEEDDPEEFIQDAEKKLQGMVRGVVGISAQIALESKKSGNSDDGNIKEVEDIIANQIVPQSEEYKIGSFINNIAIFNFDIEHKINNYKGYIKNILAADEYETANKNVEQLISQLNSYFGKISDYAKELDDDNPATGAAALFFSMGAEDEESGLKLLQFSAEKNNLMAQVVLALAYWEMGTPEAVEKFEYWFNVVKENYIEGVDIPAMQGKIQMFFGILNGLKENYDDALSFLEKAVANETFEAANMLGSVYYTGEIIDKTVIPVDYDKALKYFKIAAENGIPEAQNDLGFMYLNGKGTATDEKKALKWYQAAANNGYPRAQAYMARFYKNGECGLSINLKEYVKWYERYAENILAETNPDLGSLTTLLDTYLFGEENPATNEKIEPNYKKGVALAEKILSKHGAQPHNELTFDCMETLAKMYCEGGYGIKENKALFLQWSRTGANAGDYVCQYNLGTYYASNGDLNNARLWLEKSASQGYELAIEYLANLNSKMNKTYDRDSLPSANNSDEEEINPDDFNPLTEVLFTVFLLIIFFPIGLAYGAYFLFVKIPKVNKALEKRKKRGK